MVVGFVKEFVGDAIEQFPRVARLHAAVRAVPAIQAAKE